ncbi:MAG TPA: hypothetical protein VMW76_09095 [Bacteroidales bacterium]|nr:hypothetical protein [Bacteroidales bacterium]
MHNESCDHHWEMVNIRPGFIVTETCHKCDLVSTYFSLEDNPPLEEYRDGDHFWNVMTSAQSISFDLQCKICNTLVSFRELSSLMLCTGCDDKCEVGKLMRKDTGYQTSIYVAFGFKPFKEKAALSIDQIKVLEDYYDHRRNSSTSRIRIVSFKMIDDLDSCTGEFIWDRGMLALTPPETK